MRHLDESEIIPGFRMPSRSLQFRYMRSRGPGGQNVNKVNTKVTLRLPLEALANVLGPAAMARLRQIPGGQITGDDLLISCDVHRSQAANRRQCLAKLRAMVVRARHRPRPRKRTAPSAASIERRLRAKRYRSQVKSMRYHTSLDQAG